MILSSNEKVAIAHGDRKIMYSEFHAYVAHFHDSVAIEKGARVLIFSENRPGWIYALYSIWMHQGTLVTIDYMLPAAEVAYIIEDSRPTVAFVSKGCRAILLKALSIADKSVQIIEIDELEQADVKPAGWLSIDPPKDDTAVIIYTSGTTGNPKGVMLSFENLLVNLQAVCIDIPILTGEQTILVLLPLHHILPLLGTVIATFYMGGTAALAPSMAPEDIIKTLQQQQVTVIVGVPRLYAAIRKGIMDKVNKSLVARTLFKVASKLKSPAFSKFVFGAVHRKFGGHLKTMVCGGAALDSAIARDYLTLGFDMLEGYGMTEAAPMITFTRPGSLIPGSPGQVVPFAEVAVRDGEIVVKGPNVMQGYWQKPEETAAVIKDGWLFTGDMGYVDKDGYLFITGRKKEIIILSNGKNINPSELEEKLLHVSPVLSEVGVFQKGDSLHAIVVLDQAKVSAMTVGNVNEYLREEVFHDYNRQVPSYKKILNFTVVGEELPKTRLGKIKRFQLADLAVENHSKANDQREETQVDLGEEYLIVSQYIAKEKACAVRPGDHIEYDLGLDSLDKVSLQVFLQNSFGVNLEPEDLLRFENLAELTKFIAENRSRMQAEKVNWSEIIREKVHLKLPSTWVTNQLIARISKWYFRLYFRFRAKGMDNLPEGPCIIAPNHQSFFDGLFVTAFLRSSQIDKTYFYAKEKHVRGKFLQFFANRHNVIVMDLNKDLKLSIQKMAEVLRHKKYLVIFPEGTRTSTGKLGDFKKTFAILSRELNIPIVPVSIKGAIDALPKGSHFPRPFKRINIEYLKPIYPENHTYESLANLVQQRILQNQELSRL